jgi:hypothetical protein
MIVQIAEIQIKKLYIIHPGIGTFSCGIRAVGLCSGVIFKLESSIIERTSLFPILADLRKFLKNYSMNTIPNIQNLFRAKPISTNTKIVSG